MGATIYPEPGSLKLKQNITDTGTLSAGSLVKAVTIPTTVVKAKTTMNVWVSGLAVVTYHPVFTDGDTITVTVKGGSDFAVTISIELLEVY